MWKLTIEDDEGQRTSLDLNLEEYTVGRAEDNDIRLTERNVSRKHAILRLTVDGWEIVDEGSYNGTYVNGQRVAGDGAILSANDVIHIGDYRIELHDTAADQPVEDLRPRRPDRLICVIGPVPGHEFSLIGDVLQVGRAEDAAVSINHASVSRLHAELHNLGSSRWEVVDQGSSNGIRINGVELRRGIIEPGDALELGDVRLRFVAAGKFYRPVVDMSQQLPAMPFEGMTAGVGAPASQRRAGAIAAVLFVVVGLSVGAWSMFGRPTGDPHTGNPQPPVAETEEKAWEYLDKAKKYAADGDIEMAHNHLSQIPEDSPVTEDPEFRRLENEWADAQFRKAAAETDPEQKRALLNRISETTSVSADKRKRAADEALAIAPDDERDPPRPYSHVPGPPGPRTTGAGETPGPGTTTTKTKPEPDDKGSSGDKYDPSAIKASLQAKMAAGTATKSELRMLVSICSGDGDKACRNAAYARWKAMEE